MKKLLLALGLLVSISAYNTLEAQNVNVNINLNKQPAWGPSGYDSANYYYFPDLNIYFDVNHSLFYYLSGKQWISNQYLPEKYRKYDLYSTYKVVVNEPSPWKKNKTDKKNYSKYKNNKAQVPIRNAKESKYDESKKNTHSWVNSSNNSDKKDNDKKNQNQPQNNKPSNGNQSQGQKGGNNKK